MYFDDVFLNEVKEKNNIVDIINMYTPLKRNGNRYVGLCPFHSEKTPSFNVSEEKQMYHCFGCGAGGTVIQFVMNAENYDFTEAVKFLAERAGLPLPDEKSAENELYNLKRKIYEMNKIAAKEFYKNLNSNEGSVALLYLKNREIKAETIVKFGIGYAKKDWDSIYRLLLKNGYKKEEILKSGLCKQSEKGKIYDFFRDRVMFPVFDLRGNVVAFSGRVLGDEKPKYLNTGETEVFKKKSTLFNMNNAKNCEEDYILLMEGCMDVIAVHQAGFENAVATLGTALTEEHSRLLKRFKEKVILSYDGDEAGKEATRKAVKILKKDGFNVKIIKIQNAKDPDELIKKYGREAYEICIKNAVSMVIYDIMNLFPGKGFSDESDKLDFINKCIIILSEIKNPLELEIYAKKIAEITKISYENIISQVENRKKREKIHNENNFGKEYKPKKISTESLIIKLTAEYPSYYKKIKDKIKREDFCDELNIKIFDIITDYHKNEVKPDISMIMEKLNGEEVKRAGELFIEKEPVSDFMKYFDSLVSTLKETKFIFEGEDEEEELKRLYEYTQKIKNEKKEG